MEVSAYLCLRTEEVSQHKPIARPSDFCAEVEGCSQVQTHFPGARGEPGTWKSVSEGFTGSQCERRGSCRDCGATDGF